METNHSYSEKLSLAGIVTGIITRPVATMRVLSQEYFLPMAMMIFFLTVLVSNISFVLTDAALTQLFGGLIPALLFLTFVALFYLFGTGALCYALARLFRCHGSFTTLLSLLAVANIPSVFMAPLALTKFTLGQVGEISYWLGMVILTVWAGVLCVFAVRETFQLSTGRAAILYFFPFFITMVLISLIYMIFFALMAQV